MGIMLAPQLPTTEPEYELGTKGDMDGSEWVYCRADRAIKANNAVRIIGFTARPVSTSNDAARMRIGVSGEADIPNGSYCWICVYGRATCSVAGTSSTGTAVGSQLGATGTGGRLIGLASGNARIDGLTALQAVAADSVVFVPVALMHPQVR